MMENAKTKWQIALVGHNTLGEGPVWDQRLNRLLWVDILEGKISEWYPGSFTYRSTGFPFRIGAIVLNDDNTITAATEKGFMTIQLATGLTELIANPEADRPNNRFNDGKCDPLGRFWAGTMDGVDGQIGAGKLYMLDNEGRVSVKIDRVTCSNGLAWSYDHRTLYYIDSPTRQVVAYDFEVNSGEISNRRTAIRIPATEGLPDGMTIDAAGMLWIGMWGGWKVARWDPGTGEKLDEILLPVSQVTSCTFGGADFTDLYITSASVGLGKDELIRQPHAGSLFIVKNLATGGVAPDRFGLTNCAFRPK